MKYDETTYGSGGPPAGPLVAIPSVDGPYFTKGREYPIIGHEAWTYLVRCDRGHRRAISMESGARSAHLPPRNGGWFPSELLGTFEIRTWNKNPV